MKSGHAFAIIGRWFPWLVCSRCGLVKLNNDATRRARCIE